MRQPDENEYLVETPAFNYPQMIVRRGDMEPFEITARGIRCVVQIGITACTYAIDPPGSPFWSDTGFRSFGGWLGGIPVEDRVGVPDYVTAVVERHIDAPPKSDGTGGLGGKLGPWWPHCATQWRAELAFLVRHGGAAFWSHLGPERAAEIERDKRDQLDGYLREMTALGIDPNRVAAGVTDVELPRYRRQGDTWVEDRRGEQLSLF